MKNPVRTEELRPMSCGRLIRLGNVNDGGYVVPIEAVRRARTLVSFGLRFDWSFERDFRKLNPGVVIHCYDHSVSSRNAFLFSFTELLRFFTTFRLSSLRASLTWFDYELFFRQRTMHFKQRIWRDQSRNSVTVKDVFSRVSARPVFLKVDIEGSEYRVLDDILEHSADIDAIAIEFHDVDILPDMFNECIEKIRQKFHVAHIHGNNYAGLAPFNFPSAPELTFLNKRLFTAAPAASALSYPLRELDSPNDPRFPDYELTF
jgi:FkbM family methyltransferase